MKRWDAKNIIIMLIYISALTGCGSAQTIETPVPPGEIQETEPEETGYDDVVVKKGEANEEPEYLSDGDEETEVVPVIPEEENGLLEIYADGAPMSITEDIMVAAVSPQEILSGKSIIYDRFRIDGLVFEWLISDAYVDFWEEDGVLVISQEEDKEDVQIIHVEAEGGYGSWVSLENKFLYADVNFDGVPDLLICAGLFGNQVASKYYCFLQTEDGFLEAPSFTDILNPAIDAEHELIRSQWRNSGGSHSWAEYKYQDNAYVLDRELREDCVIGDSKEEIWVWTVNGEEIGRSDELSLEEIEDLLYSEKSEWQIMDNRWRTLYNGGLMANYSIYDEP